MDQALKNTNTIYEDYYKRLLEDAKISNTILFLPNENIKTFISVLLAKDMGQSLTKPLDNGRKWTFFITQFNSPLAIQQATALKNRLPWKIKLFNDGNFEHWNKQDWYITLYNYHILIMTSDTYLYNLQHNYMNIFDANLIIFNECHHATLNHPLHKIMEFVQNGNFKMNDQPRIIGFTSSLIDINTKSVKEKLTELKQIFNATIKYKYSENYQIFSKHTEDILRPYDEHILNESLIEITRRINVFIENIKILSIPHDKSVNGSRANYYMKEPILETIIKIFVSVEDNFKESGVYVGFLATWHYIIEILKMENLYEKEEHTFCNIKLLLSLTLSEIIVIRKMLYDYINSLLNTERSLDIIKNASPKLTEFIKIMSTLKRTDKCLVIVDCNLTAKCLYHYIKDNYEKDLSNVVCDFLVEISKMEDINPFNEMTMYNTLKNDEIIEKFNENEINVLITSKILEKDVIQYFNIIVRYDFPKNFFSYVEPKSKLWISGGKHFLLTPKLNNFEETCSEYIEMEKDMKKMLTRNEIYDDDNNEDNVDVFKTKFILLTQDNAIDFLNKYCASLPHDRFTKLSPEWCIVDGSAGCIQFKLTLPLNSAIKTPIYGKLCKNYDVAKKNAAFNACRMLYKAEALDDYMLPIRIENKSVFTDSYWFPHYADESFKTYKVELERTVRVQSSTLLHGVYPKVDKESYLHVFHCIPKHNSIVNVFNENFLKLASSPKQFGILTSKKLPNISDFPIFLKSCDIDVYIKVNVDVITLNQANLERLEAFHNKLFFDILRVKDFLCRNIHNENNSYLVVPLDSSDNKYCVDWNVIDIDTFVETIVTPTTEEQKLTNYEEYYTTRTVVTPWYRNLDLPEGYFITDVKYDRTPESAFPCDQYDTYKSYVFSRYNVHVINDKQPLIEVQRMNVNNINFLTPFIKERKTKKQDFIEMLIPELCTWHKFPSDWWLKALMLPTIIQRMNQLLLAEDLAVKINSLTGQVNNNSPDSLKIDTVYSRVRGKKKITLFSIVDAIDYLKTSRIDIYNSRNTKIIHTDIERQKNTILLDVLCYNTLLQNNINHEQNTNKNLLDDDNDNVDDNNDGNEDDLMEFKLLNNANNFDRKITETPVLHTLMIHKFNNHCTFKQSDIFKALTPKLADDICNSKCLEMFGDSFIRFAVSLVLFDAFKSENQNFLYQVRKKLLDIRNLYYIGKPLNLGSYLMLDAQKELIDWIPPCFDIPEYVKEIIKEDKYSAEFLHNILIPKHEQLSGSLSDKTMDDIQSNLINFDNADVNPVFMSDVEKQVIRVSPITILKKQLVSDKKVVKCMKSLIGTYAHHFGIGNGFKFLHNIGIIPKEFVDAYKSESNTSNNESNLNYSDILPGYELLETKIGYSFRNKGLLVQAFTHPSYHFNYFECYERLEFLGDALLEFLITSYLTEYIDKKTTEIAIIKSAIVNNSTFASLSTRLGLHKFILSRSMKLTDMIDRFYKHNLKLKHEIGHEVLYYIEEKDCNKDKLIDVPNGLGDVFKSLIAAIYLDSDRDANYVWTFCYDIFKPVIEHFVVNIPKTPLKILNEMKLNPIFSTPNESFDEAFGTAVKLDVTLNEKKLDTYGFGRTAKEAKIAAAKIVLKSLGEI